MTRMRVRVLRLALGGILAVVQAGNADLALGPPYDVVSVKPNTSGGSKSEGLGFPPGGRFFATNTTLQEIIGAVYGPEFLAAGRIVGGADWINSERFDMEGRARGGPAPASG